LKEGKIGTMKRKYLIFFFLFFILPVFNSVNKKTIPRLKTYLPRLPPPAPRNYAYVVKNTVEQTTSACTGIANKQSLTESGVATSCVELRPTLIKMCKMWEKSFTP
jgi:hypothetical protein